MRAKRPLTDLDHATGRAFALALPVFIAAKNRKPGTWSPAQFYEFDLARWRLAHPQALPPELRPGTFVDAILCSR